MPEDNDKKIPNSDYESQSRPKLDEDADMLMRSQIREELETENYHVLLNENEDRLTKSVAETTFDRVLNANNKPDQVEKTDKVNKGKTPNSDFIGSNRPKLDEDADMLLRSQINEEIETENYHILLNENEDRLTKAAAQTSFDRIFKGISKSNPAEEKDKEKDQNKVEEKKENAEENDQLDLDKMVDEGEKEADAEEIDFDYKEPQEESESEKAKEEEKKKGPVKPQPPEKPEKPADISNPGFFKQLMHFINKDWYKEVETYDKEVVQRREAMKKYDAAMKKYEEAMKQYDEKMAEYEKASNSPQVAPKVEENTAPAAEEKTNDAPKPEENKEKKEEKDAVEGQNKSEENQEKKEEAPVVNGEKKPEENQEKKEEAPAVGGEKKPEENQEKKEEAPAVGGEKKPEENQEKKEEAPAVGEEKKPEENQEKKEEKGAVEGQNKPEIEEMDISGLEELINKDENQAENNKVPAAKEDQKKEPEARPYDKAIAAIIYAIFGKSLLDSGKINKEQYDKMMADSPAKDKQIQRIMNDPAFRKMVDKMPENIKEQRAKAKEIPENVSKAMLGSYFAERRAAKAAGIDANAIEKPIVKENQKEQLQAEEQQVKKDDAKGNAEAEKQNEQIQKQNNPEPGKEKNAPEEGVSKGITTEEMKHILDQNANFYRDELKNSADELKANPAQKNEMRQQLREQMAQLVYNKAVRNMINSAEKSGKNFDFEKYSNPETVKASVDRLSKNPNFAKFADKISDNPELMGKLAASPKAESQIFNGYKLFKESNAKVAEQPVNDNQAPVAQNGQAAANNGPVMM